MQTLVHLTTAHDATDVRIADRECRSLASVPTYRVVLVAPGRMQTIHGVEQVELAPVPASRFERFLYANPKAYRAIRNLQPDVLHIHDPEIIPLALAFARKGPRVIWDAHEDYKGEMASGAGKEWVPARFRGISTAAMRRIINEIDRKASAVVSATPAIAATYSNPRTVVVGNEARTEEFRECQPLWGSRRVLFTGSASEIQCFREVVEAVHQLEDCTLAIAGHSRDSSAWDWAQGVLGSRLLKLGWLSRAELANAISSASIGIVTYANWPTNQTNSPNKVFEFAAGGLPIVTTPNRSLAGITRENGFGVVVEGYDSGAIAAGMKKLLSDRQSWQQASLRGRQFAEGPGGWAQSEQRLLGVYGDVLSVRPPDVS